MEDTCDTCDTHDTFPILQSLSSSHIVCAVRFPRMYQWYRCAAPSGISKFAKAIAQVRRLRTSSNKYTECHEIWRRLLHVRLSRKGSPLQTKKSLYLVDFFAFKSVAHLWCQRKNVHALEDDWSVGALNGCIFPL